ncbi:TNF receptor-associated factor 3-like isoform X2 [Portunus trituberculatus]|uniref:TNF receptor-associated factor 3-like isoform X2 n=1 Tax=Portunus trituberculatus TaxID=210409 RepID=UPI001E1CB6B4|nr:TNF receptor-associated factor 3-like isoform X2 [Portunus trituberculatus]
MWTTRLYVVAACAVACCSAQDGIHSMLNQLAQNSGSDVQSLSSCMISTRDLISTAQSTATRVLQGVCNPRELNNRFVTLERQVASQFNVLKTMVLNIENQLRGQDQMIRKNHGKLRKELRALGGSGDSSSRPATAESRASYRPEENIADTEYGDDYEGQEGEAESPRDPEIYRFNSTMHQENGEQVFTYYWMIRDITYKMENWGRNRSLRSSSFYIFQGGYRMYLRIFPNQQGENFYVRVGVTQGEYDNSLDWPFRLKHQVRILDHSSPPEDLVSRLWDPRQLCSEWHWRLPDSGDNYECVGLGFTKETLLSRNYIINDAVVIKLTVLLSL